MPTSHYPILGVLLNKKILQKNETFFLRKEAFINVQQTKKTSKNNLGTSLGCFYRQKNIDYLNHLLISPLKQIYFSRL